MILTTTENIPGRKYEIIGIVIGNGLLSITSKDGSYKALEKLESEALKLGADAVICIKAVTTARGSQSYIGTAVKFID